jgi:hypothetical protein
LTLMVSEGIRTICKKINGITSHYGVVERELQRKPLVLT